MGQEMTGWRRYAVLSGGMILAGAICAPAAAFSVSPTGTLGPTVLQAQSPFAAGFVTLLCFALATALATLVGRMVNAAVGLFVLGSGLAVIAVRSGTIRDLAFAEGSLGLVAFETLLWGGLLVAAAYAVFRVAGPLGDFGPEYAEGSTDDVLSRYGLRALAASCIVLPFVWLIARSELSGQTLAAVVIGAMAAGLLARMLSPAAQPWLLFAVPCLFGALGHLIGVVLVQGSMADAYVNWSIPSLSLPRPIDYAAGSLIGVSIGLGWARSFNSDAHAGGTDAGEEPA